MSNVAVLRESTHGKQVWVWCPGCQHMHPFTIESDGRLNSGITWDWNGSLESPTFSPSLICYTSVHICEGEHSFEVCDGECGERSHTIYYRIDGEVVRRKTWEVDETTEQVLVHEGPHTRDPAWGGCHSFLREGRWEFLGDSAHALAGQTVDMVPLPDWYTEAL